MNRVLVSVVLLAFTFAATIPGHAQTSVSEWTPPKPRLKGSRPFSPKPFTGHNIFKDDAEKWLADAIIKLEVGPLDVLDNKEINDYVSAVGMNLALYSKDPKKKFEFIILDDEDTGAFNVGGGRIYVRLGLLREVQSEDELAGVLAHEIGHDVFQHAGKAVTRQMFWLTNNSKIKSPSEAETALAKLNEKLANTPIAIASEVLLGFARFAELEADRAAFYNLHKAGYNPRWFRKRLEKWNRENKEELGSDFALAQFLEFFLGTHPPTSQRVTALKWEANWVTMPPSEQVHKNAAFDAIKSVAAKL